MKKYNTPEIEALALETVDVIATSGDDAANILLKDNTTYAGVTAQDGGDFEEFSNRWSW